MTNGMKFLGNALSAKKVHVQTKGTCTINLIIVPSSKLASLEGCIPIFKNINGSIFHMLLLSLWQLFLLTLILSHTDAALHTPVKSNFPTANLPKSRGASVKSKRDGSQNPTFGMLTSMKCVWLV